MQNPNQPCDDHQFRSRVIGMNAKTKRPVFRSLCTTCDTPEDPNVVLPPMEGEEQEAHAEPPGYKAVIASDAPGRRGFCLQP